MNNILITGATGYLGSLMALHLHALKYNLIILKRPTSSLERLESILDDVILVDWDPNNPNQAFEQSFDVDTILHCATNYGRDQDAGSQILAANLLFPLQLMQSADQFSKGISFINVDTVLPASVNPYALAKSQLTEWLKLFSHEHKIINVSFEQFYGPNYNNSQFVNYLINSFDQKIEKIDLTLGQQFRDFIYIEDVISALWAVMQKNDSQTGFFEYEASGGEKRSLREIVELIKVLCNNTTTKLNFGARAYRESELMDIEVNLQAISKLGWKAKYSLETGLAETIKKELG